MKHNHLSRTLLMSSVFLWGCSHLRLHEPLIVTGSDWKLYGGNIQRTNAATSAVEPPFTKIWEYDVSAGFGTAPAAAAGGLLFVGNLQGEVHVIEVTSGSGRGSFDFGSAISGAPAIDGDTLFVALAHDEESVIAYNLLAGSVFWRAKLGDVETSPLLLSGKLYVTSLKGIAYCLDQHSGAIVWQYRVPGNPTTLIHSSPASDGTIVTFGCDNGSIVALDAASGTTRWLVKVKGSVLATPSIRKGTVFVGSLDSTFYAFDASTGRRFWEQPLSAKIYSSQAIDDNRIYVGTAGGTVACLDQKSGTILWKYLVNSPISAVPIISGNVIYVGCLDKTLYALNANTGELIWNYKTRGRLKASPLVYQQYLILFAENHSVIALKHSEESSR